MKNSKAPIWIAAFVLLFNLALAYAQTNGTNTLPAVPTEESSNLGTLLVGALVAVGALITGIVAYLKKKKTPAA